MVKVGKLVKTDHQLCMAHGIHLAVVDVLYKKIQTNNLPEDGKKDGNSDDEDDDSEGVEFDLATETDASTYDLQAAIQPLVGKIRKVVYLFRRSPKLNDSVLQKYVKEELGKELSLIKDTKTKWNSLVDMLQRFQSLKNCVRKGLIDINFDIQFSDNEMTLLSEITTALLPIKLAVEKLCSRNINLYTADNILKFMLDELFSQNSSLSSALKTSLLDRIKQRRTNNFNVFGYLNNSAGDTIRNDYGIFDKNQSKVEITKAIVTLIQRLSDDIDDTTHTDEIEPATPNTSALMLSQRFNLAMLKNGTASPKNENGTKELIKIIKKK